MDKDLLEYKLAKKLKTKPKHMTPEQITESHLSYIEYHKKTNPDEILVIPMEEMAELTQHLSKILRCKETPTDVGFLEELADVQICLDNLMLHFNIDKETIEYIKDIKFERANAKIKTNNA